MGYDGLGGDDVLRVLADVRRAYNIDPERITLTGLSMGGGGTWPIGLRHPELFAALAPGLRDQPTTARMIRPADAALYDLPLLDSLSPPAIAENAAHLQVLHLSRRPGPDGAGRRFAADGRAVSRARLAGQERPLHGIPGRRPRRLGSGLQGRRALADAGRDQARSGGAQGIAGARGPAAGPGHPRPVRQERPARAPAPVRLRDGRPARRGGRRAGAGHRAGRLGTDGRRALLRQGRPRRDTPKTAGASTWCWWAPRRSTRWRGSCRCRCPTRARSGIAPTAPWSPIPGRPAISRWCWAP